MSRISTDKDKAKEFVADAIMQTVLENDEARRLIVDQVVSTPFATYFDGSPRHISEGEIAPLLHEVMRDVRAVLRERWLGGTIPTEPLGAPSETEETADTPDTQTATGGSPEKEPFRRDVAQTAAGLFLGPQPGVGKIEGLSPQLTSLKPPSSFTSKVSRRGRK